MASTAQFILTIAAVFMASWINTADQRLRRLECVAIQGEIRVYEMNILGLITLKRNDCWKDGKNVWHE